MHAVFNQMLTGTYPGWESGINVTAESEFLMNPNYNNYLFWDGMHPTSKAHEVGGDAAYSFIVSASPSAVPCRDYRWRGTQFRPDSGTANGLRSSGLNRIVVQAYGGAASSGGTAAASFSVMQMRLRCYPRATRPCLPLIYQDVLWQNGSAACPQGIARHRLRRGRQIHCRR